MDYSDALLIDIMTRTKVIACVGMSPNPERPSQYVSRFLQTQGYRVIPVNPGHVGGQILGETVYGDLAGIPADANVDFVDIFRRSDAVPAAVDQALAHLPGLRTIWMQLGGEHAEAAALAAGKGITVIQNRCPRIEFPRLAGLRQDTSV